MDRIDGMADLFRTFDFCKKLETLIKAEEPSASIRIVPKLDPGGISLVSEICAELVLEISFPIPGTVIYRKLCIDVRTEEFLMESELKQTSILRRYLSQLSPLLKSPTINKPSSESNFVGDWGHGNRIASDLPICVLVDHTGCILEFSTAQHAFNAYLSLTGVGRIDANSVHILQFDQGKWFELNPENI